MGTRKSEWWASIKPILEREEVKNDAKALAKELSDILEFKVTDADSLEQLTKEFNKQLANMGKQQIVFSEKTLQGIVSQFANAIAEGLTVGFNAGSGQVETKNIGNNLGKSIGDGVAQGIVSGVKDGISAASHDIIAQLNDLQKRKNELHEQSANLDKKLSKYERLSEISTMEYDEFKPLPLDGDIDEQAQRIMGEFIDAEDALNEVTSGTKEYNAALIKALQAAEQLYRMSRTINANKDLVKDKTLLSDFEFTSLSDTTADVFEKADADFNKILRNFYKYYENQIKNIKVELGQIDEQLIVLKQNKVEIIDQEKSKYALKTLKEIEDAQKRIEQKNKRSGGKTISGYLSAIEYEPGSESLQFLSNRYESSSNEDWESQYRWLVKFVKEYENYAKQIESETDKIKQKNMRARQKQYASLYEDLKPMAENAENSLRQVLNMQKIEAPSDIVGGSGSTTEDVTNAEKIAASERLAREEAEKKTKAEKEAAEFAKQKRIEEEKAAKAAEKKRIEEEATAEANRKAAEASEKEKIAKAAPMTNTLRNVVDFSGKQSKEYMSLIGADATTDVVGGEDYTVATDVLVEQLIDNVKKSILMSLHNHPDDMLAFTPSDIVSYGKLYKAQGVDIHGIIADGVVQTIDFTDISQEVILQVAQAFSKNLSEVADKSEGLFSFKDGDLKVSDDVQALVSESPDAYNKIKDQLQFVINNALSKAFTDNNLQPTIKTFNKENLQQLAEYLLQVGQNAGIAVNEAEKLNTLMSIKDKIIGGKKEETSAHQENTEAIKNETKVQEELNNVKSQTANIDDDSETIAKENGALEDKLELLRDIADQYAANITQKQRDRYEELNQKDMDTGLSDKEDERYYELGEQIDAADSALEEFGQTYDRIILKLENGKKVEILPDDKGLRSLYKFSDEYGETYGGVEIEDVIFERVKQEANAHQENTVAIKDETKAQQELNNVNIQAADDNNSKKIQSYEELNSILKEYLDLEKQKKKFEYTDEDWEWDSISGRYSSLNSLEQTKDDFDTQWKRVLNIKNAIKNGYDSYLDPETKSSERLQENTLEDETKRLKAIALAYADNTEANLDLLNKTQRKFVDDVVNARNVWQEDFESRRIPYNEHNDPIEKRQYEIESIIIDSTSLDNMTGILHMFNQAKSISQFDSDTVERFAKYLGIELPQATQTAGKAIDGLNNNLEETRNTAKMPDAQIGTGDASSADVNAANAEAEKQRLENERLAAEKLALQQEYEDRLKAKDAEIAEANRKREEAELAERVAQDEASAERHIRDTEAADAEEKFRVKDGIIQELREQLTQVQSGEGGAKASIDVEELKSILNAITYNVKVVQDTDSVDNKVTTDEAELKNVLNSITYNVKIAHDDTDNTANKISLDESALESTLKRVFANILGPNVEQDNTESNNAPWALESTLNGVIKETLDQIQTNTAKPESLEVAPAKADVDNVLATENTLAAIKTAVEAINTKVVKGTKAQTSGGSSKKTGVGKKNAESYAGSQYFPEKLKTQTMYLAKFRAQLMSTGKLTDDIDAQIYQLLDGLKQVKNGPDFSKWNQQFLQLKTSVGITDIFEGAEDKEITASYKEIIELQKIRNKLELEYEKAEGGSALKQFYAEQLAQMDSTIAKQQTILDNEEYEAKLAKMRAEQARKLGEFEAKSADKDSKKKATNDKQMAKKQAMVGKAGNAISRAENVWLGAQDTDEPLPTEFNTRINELYDKLVALREKQNEVNQAPMASPEQQKELRNQTIEVNSLTNEIGDLLSEYKRLSGENAEVIGKNALGADAKFGAYEQQLKQAVKAKYDNAQIKSFDAATKTLTYTVKTGKNEFTEYTAAVRRADNALVSVRGTTKRTETFFEATVRKMKELTSYFSGMTILSRLGQELKRGIQYVKEIDLALTELKKVTDETQETYDKFLQTAAKTANKVGSTIKDVVSSTADWARLNI